MSNADAMTLAREYCQTLRGNLWPNGLGFDTRGADGHTYEVWPVRWPAGQTFPRWGVRRVDGAWQGMAWGEGLSPLTALADCRERCQ